MSRRLSSTAGAALLALAILVPGARAAVVSAETVLPPGQSGYVSLPGVSSGSGSPHLYDQTDLYTSFRWKPALFNQPAAATETPKAGVSIARDAYGVPDVTADNEDDMWWGAGYAVAEDRLFQLDLFRHAAEGRLSEIVGKPYLDDDRIVRRDLYTTPELQAMFDGLPGSFQQRIRDYAAGINAYYATVAGNPLALPAESTVTTTDFAPWTPLDTVAIGVYLARTIPTNADPESLELANMRGVQLSGAKALDALVPLRTPKPVTSVPASSGSFPSQPGRTRKQERAAEKRSIAFVKGLPMPDAASSGALLPVPTGSTRAREDADSMYPRLGGSYMYAIRGTGGHAYLFNGPQLGYDAPEKLLELELHAPGIDLRGMTAAGAPVIASGFNDHVAFGITTGASDTDDLYAEKLVPGHPDEYMYKGKVMQMDCRTETLDWSAPPSDALSGGNPSDSGSQDVQICRTIHGPVEERAGGYAYARRFAAWKHELTTLVGLAGVDAATSVADINTAIHSVTWNENLVAADDKGNIGFWHPGDMPLRPKGWDERLPYPGDGRAEWRGLLPPSKWPHAINPKQGWLASWNNLPSTAWTSGDGTARKRLDGAYFRAGWLFRLVRNLAKHPSVPGMEALLHRSGTVAQQFPLDTSHLRRADKTAAAGAKVVLDTLLGWDGSYATTNSAGTVGPGVATWEAFRAAAAKRALAPFGAGASFLADDNPLNDLYGGYHHGVDYHLFDASHAESFALRTLPVTGYQAAAADAYTALVARFGNTDPTTWREPRTMYQIGSEGAESPASIPFTDRGTYEELIELGPSAR